MSSTTRAGIRRLTLALGLSALIAASITGPLHAQDGDEAGSALVAVGEARDAANARIDEVHDSIDTACATTAPETCLVNHVSVELPAVADELNTYADLIEGLEVPEAFRDDAETQVTALRAAVDLVDASVAAAAAADQPALGRAFEQQQAAAVDLAAELDPEWARAAFVTSLGSATGDNILAFAGDVTAEERAYLSAVRAVPEAAAENFACFGGAINRTYGSTQDLLAALVECGAGEAVAKNEAAARAIEPPERFIDEHAWLLAGWAESTRFDRLIGEAAAEGDVAKFLANNARLSVAFPPNHELDPAFIRGGFGPSDVLDPTEPLAATEYGRGLYAALVDVQTLDPLGIAFTAIDFPQVPRAEALPAVVELASELTASGDRLLAEVIALEPPPELAADHAVIVDFLETSRQSLEDFIAAAEAGDVDGTFEVQNAAPDAYCAASAGLSEEILPIAGHFFDSEAPICR